MQYSLFFLLSVFILTVPISILACDNGIHKKYKDAAIISQHYASSHKASSHFKKQQEDSKFAHADKTKLSKQIARLEPAPKKSKSWPVGSPEWASMHRK